MLKFDIDVSYRSFKYHNILVYEFFCSPLVFISSMVNVYIDIINHGNFFLLWTFSLNVFQVR